MKYAAKWCIVLAAILALVACPSGPATQGGSGGAENVGVGDSLDVRVIPAEGAAQSFPEPLPASVSDGSIYNSQLIADARLLAARELGVDAEHFAYWSGHLTVEVFRADGSYENVGTFNIVTTAGKEYIVDSFQDSTTTPLDDMKYHCVGTGTTAAAVGDTECETQVETRATGTQAENGSTTYRTVGTVTASASRAITEAGLMSAATGGTLLARQVFTVINLGNGDSIQTTWDITVS